MTMCRGSMKVKRLKLHFYSFVALNFLAIITLESNHFHTILLCKIIFLLMMVVIWWWWWGSTVHMQVIVAVRAHDQLHV